VEVCGALKTASGVVIRLLSLKRGGMAERERTKEPGEEVVVSEHCVSSAED
jgi:hypothetical protein